MAGRDGFVDVLLSLPEELVFVVETYRKHMKITTKTQAFRVLIETHPDVAIIVAGLYDYHNGITGAVHGERVASL